MSERVSGSMWTNVSIASGVGLWSLFVRSLSIGSNGRCGLYVFDNDHNDDLHLSGWSDESNRSYACDMSCDELHMLGWNDSDKQIELSRATDSDFSS